MSSYANFALTIARLFEPGFFVDLSVGSEGASALLR